MLQQRHIYVICVFYMNILITWKEYGHKANDWNSKQHNHHQKRVTFFLPKMSLQHKDIATIIEYSERQQNLKQHNLSIHYLAMIFFLVSVTPLGTRSLILYIVDVSPSNTRIASQKRCRSFLALSLLHSPPALKRFYCCISFCLKLCLLITAAV